MKFQPVFALSLLLALLPASRAQSPQQPGLPRTGNPLAVPRTRTPAPAPAPPAPAQNADAGVAPDGSPVPASAAMGALPPGGAMAKPAAAPEPANISYNWTMPVDQVLDIYAQLVGRTALHTSAGPMAVVGTSTITLKTQSPLTHTEAVQALETILGMNGITIVPIGEKFFKVVSEATAPARERSPPPPPPSFPIRAASSPKSCN